MPTQGAIDVDRGVSMRQVVKFDKVNPAKFLPDPKYGGMAVYMYKDTPGIYYDVHGKPVPDGIAKLAGFDVDKLSKAKRRREALAQFDAQMKAALEMEEAEEEVIIKQAGTWKVVGLPMERAKIVDIETGEMVTAVPMSRPDALELLKHLVGVAADVENVKTEVQSAAKGKSNGSTAS